MANQQTQVDIAGMKAAHPAFEGAVGEVMRVHDGMSEHRDTLASSWHGDAAQGFTGALDDWLAHCRTVHQQLKLVTDKLGHHTGVYEGVHSDTLDQAQALKQTMAAGLPGF
ncbi:WXG100 family type VII secretion target [Streptomyces sp. NPDC101152]|uniref:WXG100 family type VII secretion target n=1 Tax=Streptomyces sp. NPDC101152 TaxID=3366116 RepID=UPI00382195B3